MPIWIRRVDKMKNYIGIWVIIAVLANAFVFSCMSVDGGSNIRCNRKYKLIYPCPHFEVVASIDEDLGSSSYSSSTRYSSEKDEPWLDEVGAERKGSDLAIIFAVIVGVDAVIAWAAILLYFILRYIEEHRFYLCKIFSVYLVAFIAGSGFVGYHVYDYIRKPGEIKEIHYNAPIIYLYDDQEREATVKLDLNGDLTCTYPRYDEKTGWIVKTSSDGVLTDENGRQYEYLYWEADVSMDPDFSKGFCVRGEDSVEFLEKALSDLGLSDKEANTFIMYWLPQLEANPYNVIAFQSENYEAVAKLDVDPLPDTVVRVNMLFYASDEYIDMEEQNLSSMNPSLSEREGFVLVEWGGGKIG